MIKHHSRWLTIIFIINYSSLKQGYPQIIQFDFPLQTNPFWGTPILGNLHIDNCQPRYFDWLSAPATTGPTGPRAVREACATQVLQDLPPFLSQE